MDKRREIRSEVEDLWRAVFGQAPDRSLAPEAMLDVLFERLPVPPHTTLRRFGTVLPPERR